MSAILLVRHAQASLGTPDYDRLSPLGIRQAAVLGETLVRSGAAPTQVLHGDLRRHRETALHAGFAGATVDPDWNEFDHVPMLEAAAGSGLDVAGEDPREAWLQAKRRWAGGGHDGDYEVTYRDFSDRVHGALVAAARDLGKGEVALVITSAGVIAALATRLLGAGVETWHALQNVIVNTGITKVSSGARGLTLLSLNDHSHVAPADVTYS